MRDLKVGDHLWYFDINRRVYRSEAGSGPIWREHWVKMQIVGETGVSWIVGPGNHPMKVHKKKLAAGTLLLWATSEGDVAKEEWVSQNSYRLSNAVSGCKNYDTLKKIAELVGYKDRP